MKVFRNPSDANHFKHCLNRMWQIGEGKRHKYECPCCEKIFKANQDIEKHIVSKHTIEKHLCKECSKMFKRKDTLKNHIEGIHQNKKKFKCSKCDKRFVTNPERVRHEQSHTTEPEMICPYCEARYSHKTALYKHTCK